MLRRAVLLFIVVLALPLLAQPRVVSRIEVRGSVPAAIILPESALVEGRAYTESDLDAAIARLRRLPFVYDARYDLDGETLVIEVDGTTTLFFEAEALDARSDFDSNRSTAAGAGGRLFLGSGGVAEGRAMKLLANGNFDASRAELRYSHYGIGGTRFFAIASADFTDFDDEGLHPDPTYQLTVGYPLTVRQTISATAARTGFSSHRTIFGQEIQSGHEQTSLNLRWAYDTTDDPLFTRSGALLSATPSWGKQQSSNLYVIFTEPPAIPMVQMRRNDGSIAAFDVAARKYWALGTRGALSAGIDASREEQDVESQLFTSLERVHRDTNAVRLSAGYGYNFFERSASVNAARHRVEVGASASRRRTDFGAESFTDDETAVNAGYVFRKPFGSVRVNLTYAFE